MENKDSFCRNALCSMIKAITDHIPNGFVDLCLRCSVALSSSGHALSSYPPRAARESCVVTGVDGITIWLRLAIHELDETYRQELSRLLNDV